MKIGLGKWERLNSTPDLTEPSASLKGGAGCCEQIVLQWDEETRAIFFVVISLIGCMTPWEELVMLNELVLCSDNFCKRLILEHCLLGNKSFIFEESGLESQGPFQG